jgi:hypothetical protein
MYTQVGHVTNRRGARVHLAVNGWAYCGAGRGRIIGPVRNIAATDRGHLCRRCGRALADRLRLDHNLITRRTDRGSRAFGEAIADMIDQCDPLTRAEVAMLAELAARLADPLLV